MFTLEELRFLQVRTVFCIFLITIELDLRFVFTFLEYIFIYYACTVLGGKGTKGSVFKWVHKITKGPLFKGF